MRLVQFQLSGSGIQTVFYPTNVDEQYRLIIGAEVWFQKLAAVGSEFDWQVFTSEKTGPFTGGIGMRLYGRYMSAGESTSSTTNLEGNEVKAQSSVFAATGIVPQPLLLPKHSQLELLTRQAADNWNAVNCRAVILEADDVELLKPYM